MPRVPLMSSYDDMDLLREGRGKDDREEVDDGGESAVWSGGGGGVVVTAVLLFQIALRCW
jgi:hypothetical protein